MKIVVSRYSENLEWTKMLPNSDVIIYNKGPFLAGTIPLPNVGREGHTFYKYIYDNYDNLDNYTAFLQGNPFDHSRNIIKKLISYLVYADKMDITVENLCDKIITCNVDYCKHHPGLPIRWVFEHLFEISPKHKFEFEFGSGGQFIVSRNQIHKRPKEFYLKIINLLKNERNPIEGYVIERLHMLVFDGDLLKNVNSIKQNPEDTLILSNTRQY